MTASATSASPTLIACRDVGLTYPNRFEALAQTSFDVQRGELISIVGPSGCGKSTLLRMIAGLLSATSGTLRLNGRSPDEARRAGLQLGFVFQEATLLPWRSVRENIRLPLELLGTPRRGHDVRIAEALSLVGLQDFADALPGQLSGGMKMRAALVRALVTHPELLLLDEPFGALDDMTRQRLNEELLGLWQRQGWSGVFITHNVYEAVFLSQRIFIMSPRPGRVIAEIAVPFPFPRGPQLRGTAEFAHLAAEVSARLREVAT